MANIVTRVISILVLYSIALFYGLPVLLHVLFRFCWSGFSIFKKTQRTRAPSCLEDPELGEHYYVTTKSGHKFHFVANGAAEKPLMLCLHGFPEFWFSWRSQLKEFHNNYRVVAPDLRGYGESYRPEKVSEYKASLLCQDIAEIIEALGYSTCVLVAHDWGGILAWDVAHRYPEVVDRLVILNAPHPRIFSKHLRSSWKQFRKSWYIFLHLLPYLPEMLYSLDDYGIIDKLFVGGAWTDQTREAYKYTLSQPGAFTAAINWYRSALLYADQQEWKRKRTKIVTAPTLILWGDQDVALDISLLDGLDEHVEKLSVKMVEGASHWVQIDEPTVVNRHIRDFLENPQ